MNMKVDILGLTLPECKEFALSLGEKAFRGEQMYGWMQKGAPMEEWTNIPASFKAKIAEAGEYRLPKIARKLTSKLDGTIKYLFEMIDGEKIESVFMKYEHGNTVCVSCQAGCRMGYFAVL